MARTRTTYLRELDFHKKIVAETSKNGIKSVICNNPHIDDYVDLGEDILSVYRLNGKAIYLATEDTGAIGQFHFIRNGEVVYVSQNFFEVPEKIVQLLAK